MRFGRYFKLIELSYALVDCFLSITGSSDQVIVGKVIRSVMRQMVARHGDNRFRMAEQVQAMATPFSASA